MNRWARIQLSIAAIGVSLFLVTLRQGFAVAAHPAGFPLHTQLALIATLLVLLAWLWVIVYLLVSRRRLATRGELGDAALRSVRRSARGALGAALLAAASIVTHVLLAGRLFTRPGSGDVHLASAVATAAIQGAALVLCARGLARHQALLEQEKRRARVLNSAGL